jgi:hypothetical protein
MTNRKIKGHALMITVFLLLSVTIVISSLLFYSYYNKLQFKTWLLNRKLADNMESAKVYLNHVEELEGDKILDIFKNVEDSINVRWYQWGVYGVSCVKTTLGNIHKSETWLNSIKSDTTKPVLYLLNNGKELSVDGSVVFHGKCFVPNGKIKSAKSKSNKIFELKGKAYKSSSSLPLINPIVKKYLIGLINEINKVKKDEEIIDKDISIKKSVSFLDSLFEIKYDNGLFINNSDIRGHIIIVSTKLIQIENTNNIEDAILIAPKIILKSGTKINAQLYATDSIVVEDKCILTYPSAIGLINVSNHNNISKIVVINSKIEGEIFTLNQFDDVELNRKVIISKGSVINGNVYCDGLLNIQADISGSVFTKKIIYFFGKNIYENYLNDCSLTNQTVFNNTSSYLNYTSGDKKIISKWLY